MILLQKLLFSIDCLKKRLRYCYAGAHTGAPLRLYLSRFRAFVQEGINDYHNLLF